MRISGACLALALLAAGCLAATESATPPGSLSPFAFGDARAVFPIAGGLAWEGARIVGNGQDPSIRAGGVNCMLVEPCVPPCGDADCERVPFTLASEAGGARVEITVEWEQPRDYSSLPNDFYRQPEPLAQYFTTAGTTMRLRLLDAQERLVAEAPPAPHFATSLFVDALPAGDYVIEVQALYGEGAYLGVAQLEPALAPRSEEVLLPDLVLRPAFYLTLEHPIGREAPLEPAARGCGPDESAEAGARRCLRFATPIGNAGRGALELFLSKDVATASVLEDGAWRQRVYRGDGSFEEREASAARYHAVHGHFHVQGLISNVVHEYDTVTGAIGAEVARGEKTGFCPVDSGLLNLSARGTVGQTLAYGGGCCYYARWCAMDLADPGREGFLVGITPGWYDTYPWWRADQYVDIEGLPDGTYALVSTADPDDHVREADETNNVAVAPFRLAGDAVEELAPSPPPWR